MTDAFCAKYLNDDYRELCQDLAATAYEEGLPLGSGKTAGWASGIVHALGWVNFLHDPSQSPHMTSTQVAAGFGVSQQTMLTKSKIIRDELDLIQLDPDWCTTAMLVDNPLVWTIDVNGFLMDARYAPRQIQEEAYHQGLIPFIPCREQKPVVESETRPKIIEFRSGQDKTARPATSQQAKDNKPNL